MSEFSEYDGGGVMPNTVHPKGPDALTPADKLRLQSMTGQETDSRAPIDPYHWQGGTQENVDEFLEGVEQSKQARAERARFLHQQEVERYKES